MPIYDFECEACGVGFEELVKNAEAAASVRCPQCGAERARRLVSAFASGSSGERSGAPRPQGRRPAGGGCGSGCGCHA
jgi:putative FmdB family regulatory protein